MSLKFSQKSFFRNTSIIIRIFLELLQKHKNLNIRYLKITEPKKVKFSMVHRTPKISLKTMIERDYQNNINFNKKKVP